MALSRIPSFVLGLAGLLATPVAHAHAEAAEASALPRVLFFTHSAGYVHDVVRRESPDAPSLAERRLVEMAEGRFDVVPSQDPAVLAADALSSWDVIVFYTTGELPVSDDDRVALLEWVAHGGAFVGVHCATDTFYAYPPYLEMVGGTFDGHPWHELVTVRVEDDTHPATRDLDPTLALTDEIYQFKDFARFPVDVLMALDTSSIDASKGKRTDGDYATTWCRNYGEGRVFYTALGHRPEVWGDARFAAILLGGIGWALDGPEFSPRPAPVRDGRPQPVTLLARDAVPSDGALSAFRQRDGSDAAWTLRDDGSLEVAPGAGDLLSRAEFGDVLVHLEFRVPPLDPEVTGQARGNSGVYVQGRYEVQVLDSYGLDSGAGDCAAIYGVRAPTRNACRRAGRWQSYDIRFRAPRFVDGKKTEDARMSVWHNGLLVQDDVPVPGPTGSAMSADEAARGPLLLQDHGNLVRYRNVWVQPLDG